MTCGCSACSNGAINPIWIPDRLSRAKVIVFGDINDFEFSQTVELLEGAC
jgi:hypothetical protein